MFHCDIAQYYTMAYGCIVSKEDMKKICVKINSHSPDRVYPTEIQEYLDAKFKDLLGEYSFACTYSKDMDECVIGISMESDWHDSISDNNTIVTLHGTLKEIQTTYNKLSLILEEVALALPEITFGEVKQMTILRQYYNLYN